MTGKPPILLLCPPATTTTTNVPLETVLLTLPLPMNALTVSLLPSVRNHYKRCGHYVDLVS